MKQRFHQIFNGLGCGNLGDELMMLGFWERFSPFEGSTVEVWDLNSPSLRWYPSQYNYLHWQDHTRCERAIRSAGAVLLVGDTPVTELLGLEWPLRSLFRPLTCAHDANVPVHAVGVGVEPISSPEAMEIFREAYLSISTWSVRSRRCEQILIGLGVEPENIVVAADLAWAHTPEPAFGKKQRDLLKRLGIDPEIPWVAVNIVNEKWTGEHAFYDSLAKAFDAVYREIGCRIVFACNETRSGDYFDLTAAQTVMKIMSAPSFLLPNRFYHPDEMISVLSSASAVISQRYHFTTEAVMAGTVPVSFARGQKLKGLLEELGLPSAGEMGVVVDSKRLVDLVRQAIENHDSLMKKIQVIERKLRKRAENNFFFLSQIS